MSEPLDPERLKKEIATTRAHLEWLESLLETQADGLLQSSETIPKVTTVEVKAPETSSEMGAVSLPEPPEEQTAPDVETEINQEKPETVESSESKISDTDLAAFTESEASLSSQIQRAKMGCIIFLVLAIGIVFFVLFGLPYLLPED